MSHSHNGAHRDGDASDDDDGAPVNAVPPLPSPLLRLRELLPPLEGGVPMAATAPFYASLLDKTTDYHRMSKRFAELDYGLGIQASNPRVMAWKRLFGDESALAPMLATRDGREAWSLHLIPERLWPELECLFALCRVMEKTIHWECGTLLTASSAPPEERTLHPLRRTASLPVLRTLQDHMLRSWERVERYVRDESDTRLWHVERMFRRFAAPEAVIAEELSCVLPEREKHDEAVFNTIAQHIGSAVNENVVGFLRLRADTEPARSLLHLGEKKTLMRVRSALRSAALFLRDMVRVDRDVDAPRRHARMSLSERERYAQGTPYAERDLAVCMGLAGGSGSAGEKSPLSLLPPEIVADKILRANMATPPASFFDAPP